MPVAATVFLSESNGAGAVVTDNVANMNFGGADVPNLVAATHPIVRATAGQSYSFTKYFRVKVAALGDSVLIQNLKRWKTAGTYNQNEILIALGAAPAYATPVQTVLSGNTIETAEPASANVGIGGAFAGQINAAPAYSNYSPMQMHINSLTPIGAIGTITIIWQYDES